MKSVSYMKDSIAKEKRWGKKCLESCAIKGGGFFFFFSVFIIFFHEALGILYIVLKNRQNFVEKNTESVMSSSPLDWRQTSDPLSHHVVPLYFCKTVGSTPRKAAD